MKLFVSLSLTIIVVIIILALISSNFGDNDG